MNALVSIDSAPLTMSSQEIAEVTGKGLSNVHRDIRSMLAELYGQEHIDKIIPEHYRNRRSEFIRDNSEAILDAITGDGSKRNHQDWRGFAWERDNRGYVTVFRLDHNHTMTLVAGYNVKLRKAIIDRWQELEAGARKPRDLTRLEILQIAIESEQKRIEAEAQRDEAVRTKALIGSKREATAMATASAAKREAEQLKQELGFCAEYATVKAVENVAKIEVGRRWSDMRAWCKAHGLQPKSVPDKLYGTVKAWPAAAWRAVLGVELPKLFGASA